MSRYKYTLWDLGGNYHTKDKSYPYEMFLVLCVFVDYVSGFIRIKHQVDINGTETLKVEIISER